MRPRWETWAVILGLAAPACAVRQYQQVTVVIQQQEPLRGYATGAFPAGEEPAELSAAQISTSLEGYGVWFDSPTYGRVWRPDEGYHSPSFTPYLTAGQWIPTTAGWYWQSDYAWGRVPFHYGRWVLDGGAWAWVPGSRFAPAWVDWRSGGGWTGWAASAPLGARAWGPFTYCAHDALAGAHVDRRVVRGAAASSLYGRTEAVPADDDTPRGPAIPAGQPVSTLAAAWSVPSPNAAAPVARPPLSVASALGPDSVERIPVARVRSLPPVVDPPVGGAAVVIRDRDLLGMSEGPSVRRPAGAARELVDEAPARAPAAPVVVPREAWTRVTPPPLPPPPDGVGGRGMYGGYALGGPMAFASRRGYGGNHHGAHVDAGGEQALRVVPSGPGPVAAPAPSYSAASGSVRLGPSVGSAAPAPSQLPLAAVR